ncbi:alpha-ribazole-5-phosphate synthase [Acetobacterium wieringae]|uniref:alpha-ribazole-5-phosphate synthase n=1 Tax=Acetobacterium wieringae TaxID=52694 RepID=UPI0026ED7D87|nr:alpha-ribazole-5-phosphate synthase [Acetobacterium wieringae]
MNTYQYRDLSVIELPDTLLVTACDSSGGVGEKPGDELCVPTKYISIFATRVCLFELLSCGTEIISLSNTIVGEMEPTGAALIQGIKEELARAGIGELPINGSTEENFKTCMTGFGIFVAGIAPQLRITPSTPGDILICIGKPKFGAALVLDDDPEIANYQDLQTLIKNPAVNEIIPCGSKGILYEATNLAAIHQCQFKTMPNDLNVVDSTGPATTVIASIKPFALSELATIFRDKLTVIGHLK